MIKLQHTTVSINGLRYVQLKSCLLKWPPHQKLASSRKLKQISGSSPFLSLVPGMDLFFLFTASCSMLLHYLIHPLKTMRFPLIFWQEKTPKRGKALPSKYKNWCISNGNASTNWKVKCHLKRTFYFQNTSKILFSPSQQLCHKKRTLRSFLPESSLKPARLEAPDITVSFVTLPSSAKQMSSHH